jgi:hypothetical protein
MATGGAHATLGTANEGGAMAVATSAPVREAQDRDASGRPTIVEARSVRKTYDTGV